MITVLALATAVTTSSAVPPASPRFLPPIVHATALFTTLRLSEAYIWPHPFAETSTWGEHYREAYTMPPIFDRHRNAFEWDGDAWYLNVVGHGVMGSELYLRGRACGFGLAGALGWAALTSGVWEYVFEANGVRPSAQDLIYTPVAGLVLGEARWITYRAASGIADRALRGFVQTVLDPLGDIDHAITHDACAR